MYSKYTVVVVRFVYKNIDLILTLIGVGFLETKFYFYFKILHRD